MLDIHVFLDKPRFEDSISLQDLGLSDACLATLAREANTGNCSPVCDLPIQQGQEIKHQDKETPTYHCYDQDVLSNTHHPIDSYQSTYHWNDQDVLSNAHHRTESYQSTTENIGNPEIFKEEFVADRLLEVSKEEYDKTPSWLRGLASWEELDDAIRKINNLLSGRAKRGDQYGAEWLDQDDLEPLGFGPKAKPFLLLLVRMNCLTIEQQGDATIYRVNLK